MALGFLGLGQMGGAIAERMQGAGAVLHVFDPNQSALEPFIVKGAQAHASPTDVADAAPIVFACLPNGAVSESVARDVAKGKAARTYVEMSTIGGSAQAKVQATGEARGITLVDCPISGGPKGARQEPDRYRRRTAGGTGRTAPHRQDIADQGAGGLAGVEVRSRT
jgi:3-hydroxyisobutyrate dehydrogenase-like beta-hydroxyacid dehydrogenase